MTAAEDPRPSRFSGLSCPACEGPAEPAARACAGCGGPLFCRYELEGLESASGPGPGLRRWSALLPVGDSSRLGSGAGAPAQTLPLPGLGEELGLGGLELLRGAGDATGSVSARGFRVAAAALAERGVQSLTLASAGPSAAPCAAAAKEQGLACRVALPSGATPLFRLEARLLKARVVAVLGDRGVAGGWTREHPGGEADAEVSAFCEPYRLEGMKTLAFEIAERAAPLPDAVVVPTGSGLDLVALAKGFAELREAGLLEGEGPRLVAAQVRACAPIARAFEEGAEDAAPWGETHRTLAESLRDPEPRGARLALKALRDSGGLACAVSEGQLVDALRRAARLDGRLPGPEGAAALAAVAALREAGELEGARVLCLDPNALWRSPESLEAAGTG